MGTSQSPGRENTWLKMFSRSHITCICGKQTKHTALLHVWEVAASFTPTSTGRGRFSLCGFTSSRSLRGPPWNEGHRPKVRHETSVLEVPAQEQHEHSFYSSSTNTFITRYAGIAHHWALKTSGRGWAGSKAVHGMECSGARSLYWRSLSVGAAA